MLIVLYITLAIALGVFVISSLQKAFDVEPIKIKVNWGKAKAFLWWFFFPERKDRK